MCQVSRTTPGASKNVKFRLSRNSTKFDVVGRFRETIPTVNSILSSEIYKNSGFLTEITILPFLIKLEFSQVLQQETFPCLFVKNFLHLGLVSLSIIGITISR